MSKFESLKRKAPALVIIAAVIGGYINGSYQLEAGDKANTAPEYKPSTDPYERERLLVPAPLPLTVEEAIGHYVGMDRPRTGLTDAGVERVVDELTDQYEAQTGASADQPFPGNPNGSRWIRIDLSE